MKVRLADYIANFLVEHGVSQGFTVIGGGAMHLNDAFGHKAHLKMLYNHHEQASGIAADCYARINNKPALLCVTTGPGGINALNGVASAYLDSVPMIVVSGQVRYDTSARYEKKKTGAVLRSMGDQEFDIVTSVKNMTKYAVSIENPNDIRFELERSFHLATTGRMGPVWIDVPVNFQGMMIEDSKLKSYFGSAKQKSDDKIIPSKVKEIDIKKIVSLIAKAKRPVIYPGFGVRLSNSFTEFRKLIKKLNIPVVTYWDSIDLIETDNDLYCGRAGNMGDRAGNFAVQNSDLVIAIGTRISIRQTGYNYKDWARAAKVVMVDIDKEEFKKHTLHVDMKVHADAKEFICAFDKYLEKNKVTKLFTNSDWNKQCILWKQKYPVVDKKKYVDKDKVNVYAFFDALSKNLKEGSVSVATSGASCVAGHQSYIIKKGTRFINNNVIASMGYGLPASIGACIANNKKQVIAFEGDGGLMMNIQELQTLVTNKLPVKLFIINNNGYHSLRITQTNLFNKRYVGIGPESGDLSFPNYKKVITAFGLKYYSIKDNKNLDRIIIDALKSDEPAVIEVFTNETQTWEPKSSGRRNSKGEIESPPLEDMAPFLSREELKENMYI